MFPGTRAAGTKRQIVGAQWVQTSPALRPEASDRGHRVEWLPAVTLVDGPEATVAQFVQQIQDGERFPIREDSRIVHALGFNGEIVRKRQTAQRFETHSVAASMSILQ